MDEIILIQLRGDGRDFWVNDREIRLSKQEAKLLGYLMKNACRVCSISEIAKNVMGYAEYNRYTASMVRAAVVRLRKRIEPSSYCYIHNTHGHGYYLRANRVSYSGWIK